MPRALVLFLAERDGRTDRRRAVPARRRHAVRPLLGRRRDVPGLHFETCYYQGIDYCLREGLRASSPARRASTSSRAASCRRSCAAATGSRDARFARRVARTGARRKRASVRALCRDAAAHSPFAGARPDAPSIGRDDARCHAAARLPIPHAPFPPVRAGAARSPTACWRSAATCRRRACSMPIGTASFPGSREGQPILWWSPDPRMVFRTDGVRLSSRFRRGLRHCDWRVRADTAFDAGDRRLRRHRRAPASAAPGSRRRCARPTAPAPRSGMRIQLEVFDGERLVGGIYGVAVGRMFFGESMFSARIRRLEGRAGRPRPASARLGLAADRRAGRERRTCCSLGAAVMAARALPGAGRASWRHWPGLARAAGRTRFGELASAPGWPATLRRLTGFLHRRPRVAECAASSVPHPEAGTRTHIRNRMAKDDVDRIRRHGPRKPFRTPCSG